MNAIRKRILIPDALAVGGFSYSKPAGKIWIVRGLNCDYNTDGTPTVSVTFNSQKYTARVAQSAGTQQHYIFRPFVSSQPADVAETAYYVALGKKNIILYGAETITSSVDDAGFGDWTEIILIVDEY